MSSRPAKKIASDDVRAEWLNRVEAEYRSAALTQHLGLWLIQLGASPDLVRDALRIVDDELVHAEMSHQVYIEAGGDAMPTLDRQGLRIPSSPDTPLELNVLLSGVRFYCLGETVAVPLFSHLRKQCVQSLARQTLDRILVDEVRHRDFGWTLLRWLNESLGNAFVKTTIEQHLPTMLAEIEKSYASMPDARNISDDDRAWGLAPAGEYADIFARTIERDYRPRFNEFDIQF